MKWGVSMSSVGHNKGSDSHRDTHKQTWDKVWSDKRGPDNVSALWRILRRFRSALVPYSSPFNYFLRAWLADWVAFRELRVLEIGGGGGLGLVLGRACRSYSLLDYSEEAVKRARKVLANQARVTCILGDMYEYVPTELPDLVISLGLIEHFFGQEWERCLRSHIRLTGRYVCVGAPADIPINWWRHFRFEATKEYPEQRPVSERELFEICIRCGLKPVAMTRIDPKYGRMPKKRIGDAFYRCLAAWWPRKKWAMNRPEGGLVIMLAEKPTDSSQEASETVHAHTRS